MCGAPQARVQVVATAACGLSAHTTHAAVEMSLGQVGMSPRCAADNSAYFREAKQGFAVNRKCYAAVFDASAREINRYASDCNEVGPRQQGEGDRGRIK